MNMIESHMEQIASSSAAICELPFLPPKIFANALLQPHDITALIRDTEAHERALFKAVPPKPGSFEPAGSKGAWFDNGSSVTHGNKAFPGLKANTAVGRILGGDVLDRLRRGGHDGEGKNKGEVDVDALLKGAERLVEIYPVAGTAEKISSMRSRYQELEASIAHYEELVAKQTAELGQASHAGYAEDDFGTSDIKLDQVAGSAEDYRHEDFLREEAEMRELELKKQTLEQRVTGIDKDLGGLMR